MNTKKNCLLLYIILNLTLAGKAQDVVYSQFYANPMYLNPALTGSKFLHRITLNYRNQWPGIQKGYVSYHASWDQHYKAISGALGVIVNNEVEGDGVYNRFSASGIYSYRLQISENTEVKAALQAGYLSYRFNWDKLVWGDQMINVNTGQMEPTSENAPERQKVGNVDFSAGLLAGYKRSLYFGVAVNHLTRPNISFYEGTDNRLDMRWTVHTGLLFNLQDGLEAEALEGLSVSPNLVYVQQGKFHQINGGMYVNKFPFVLGFWMRHNFENPDAFIIMLGFQQKEYKIGYSFDYTLSRISVRSGGAHEVSLAYLFHAHKKTLKYKQIRHPDF